MDRRTALARMLAGTLCGTLGVATLTSFVRAAEAPTNGIAWQKDLDAAHRAAIESNKPLLIVFGADWCSYCRKMEKKTLADSQVTSLVEDSFVPVFLDFDQEQRVAKILEIRNLPSSVILSPQSDLLGKIVGYVEPNRYAEALKSAKGLQTQIQQVRFEQTGQTDH